MSTNLTLNNHKEIEIYLVLMHELVIRIDLVDNAFEGKLGLPRPYAREFAYLQFRRMCELIAIGSAFINGEKLTGKNDLSKVWSATKLMHLLQLHHSRAFPIAAEKFKTEHGFHIQTANPDSLTYTEFQKLYNECNEVLHRGTQKTVQSATFCKEKDYNKVIIWQRKIKFLMKEHIIKKKNSEDFYFVSVRTQSGFPECSLFEIDEHGEANIKTHTLTISD